MSMLFLAIPLTLFVLFVLPVWLWLHYNNRGPNGSLTQNEQQRLLQLTDDALRDTPQFFIQIQSGHYLSLQFGCSAYRIASSA